MIKKTIFFFRFIRLIECFNVHNVRRVSKKCVPYVFFRLNTDTDTSVFKNHTGYWILVFLFCTGQVSGKYGLDDKKNYLFFSGPYPWSSVSMFTMWEGFQRNAYPTSTFENSQRRIPGTVWSLPKSIPNQGNLLMGIDNLLSAAYKAKKCPFDNIGRIWFSFRKCVLEFIFFRKILYVEPVILNNFVKPIAVTAEKNLKKPVIQKFLFLLYLWWIL